MKPSITHVLPTEHNHVFTTQSEAESFAVRCEAAGLRGVRVVPHKFAPHLPPSGLRWYVRFQSDRPFGEVP